ncbi:MAG TPA: hypothetical protein HA230_00755 [Candidatus Aenigmarchaeota archaeon]|nr:hypothetical protein [Candidatus Aenigmarchaeota archaeon]
MADPYRAFRQFERMFGGRDPFDPNIPRPEIDYRGLTDGVKLMATIVYDRNSGEIKVIRANPSEQPQE